MELSKKLQQKLDKLVPKKEQVAFVERAVEEAVNKIPTYSEELEVFVDGGARGNPGHAGGGFVLFLNGEKILEGSEYYGKMTNNQAEYLALRTALRETYSRFPNSSIKCYMDSQLVVEQMNGNYKVKSENIYSLFEEVKRISEQFKSFSVEHIPREENSLADRLANKAMDRKV